MKHLSVTTKSSIEDKIVQDLKIFVVEKRTLPALVDAMVSWRGARIGHRRRWLSTS